MNWLKSLLRKGPQPKQEVMVKTTYAQVGYIYFYAKTSAAIKFKKFGTLLASGEEFTSWTLKVDPRYDFDEVVAYLEGYG